jgi:hypothetical protein
MDPRVALRLPEDDRERAVMPFVHDATANPLQSHAALDAASMERNRNAHGPRVKLRLPEDDKKREIITNCLYIIREAAFSRQPLAGTIKEQVL